nr:immunoglobulin heavy chain junction region [Mus musculus]MBK4185054.1 immunoglobulin heavy chain junction region [Mus musculus]
CTREDYGPFDYW